MIIVECGLTSLLFLLTRGMPGYAWAYTIVYGGCDVMVTAD